MDVHIVADGCSSRSQVDRLFALDVREAVSMSKCSHYSFFNENVDMNSLCVSFLWRLSRQNNSYIAFTLIDKLTEYSK